MVKTVQATREEFVADEDVLIVQYVPPTDPVDGTPEAQTWEVPVTIGSKIRIETKTEAIESLAENRWWLIAVDTKQFLFDRTSPTGERLVDVQMAYDIVQYPTEIDSAITADAVSFGQEVWGREKVDWLKTVNFWLDQQRQRQFAQFQITEADRRLAYEKQLADQNLSLQQQVDVTNLAIQKYQADYQAMVDAVDAQFERDTAFAEASNQQIEEENRTASLYNRVLVGDALSAEEQEELLALVDERPDLFSPENGFLSSSQIRNAITDPSLLEERVSLSGDVSSLSVLNGVTSGSTSTLTGMNLTQALEKYSFVCTCSDFTGRAYNPETGLTREWDNSNPAVMSGQQVCKHILSVWNTLGYISAADIPPDPVL